MSSDRYDGLTRRQWANRVTDFNPEFDKSLLIKHYTAKQLGKCMEGGNIKLTKALKNKTLPADILTISRMPPAKKAWEGFGIGALKNKCPRKPPAKKAAISKKPKGVEEFLRVMAAQYGFTVKPVDKKARKPAKKHDSDDESDSDLESCSSDEE